MPLYVQTQHAQLLDHHRSTDTVALVMSDMQAMPRESAVIESAAVAPAEPTKTTIASKSTLLVVAGTLCETCYCSEVANRINLATDRVE